MTITVLPMDATAGAPAYAAKNARQAQAAVYGNPTGRVFGTRSGWRVGTLSSIVSVTSTTWTLNPCVCVIEPAASLYQGCYGWASDAVITGSVTAADGTNPRIDILYIQVNDSSAGDGSGLLSAPVSYLAGAPAPSGTQVAPALPPRSFLVATIAVPKSGAGSPTVTLNQQYFAAAGGALPVVSLADRGTLTPYTGMPIIRLDLGCAIEIWNGTIWDSPTASTTVPPPDGGWQIDGGIVRVNAQGFKQVHATLKLTRLTTPTTTINQTFNALLAATIPAGWRPVMSVQGMAVMSTTGGTWRGDLECLIGTNGDIAFRIASGSLPLSQNDVFYVNISWWQ